jgi:DNA-binding response OmpR family regulator
MHCLLVASDRIFGDTLSAILQRMGDHVEHVRSHQEAVSRLSVSRFDLVLIGSQEQLELAGAVKRAAPSTRVILSTGNVALDQANGVDVILYKPFSVEELSASISALLPSAVR